MQVLTLLLIGLVISLEPIPLTAFILILASTNGVKKGAGFIFGWLVSLAAVVAATVLLTGNHPPRNNTAPSVAALIVKIVIGAVLVIIAVRKWRKLGAPKPPKKTPKWQTGIDRMSIWFAIALGFLTQPWGLVAAGVATIVDMKLSTWESYVAVLAFCLVATITYIIAEVYAGFKPTEAQAILTGTMNWINTHTDQVIIIVSLVLGFWLIVQSTYLIVS
jgi:threonine/homoserine/homoserine lactone efflux protein